MNRADLFRALGTLSEPAGPGHAAVASALRLGNLPASGEYADVFLFNAYPYSSVYLGAEGMMGGEARDRVAGFWRALGLVPPAEPDHLAALLGLYAALLDGEARAVAGGDAVTTEAWRRSRKALLWEHLASWLPPYLEKVATLAAPFYARWARLLADALDAEIVDVGPAEVLPLQLRAAPALPDLDDAGGTWVAALLAAVRTGVVLTRWDLHRAAAALGLGVRVGERAFVLRSLLEQDAGVTVDWLADEAARAASRHARAERQLGAVAAFWQRRAEACEAALRAVRPAHERMVSHGGG